MGWTSMQNTFKSSRDFYNHELANQFISKATVIDFSICGNEIYQLVECEGQTTIHLTIIKREDGIIYWKGLHESAHPYYFKCPVKFLNASTDNSESAIRWRKACREYHANLVKERDFKDSVKRLQPGSLVELKSGLVIEFRFNHNRSRFAGRLSVKQGECNNNQLFAYRYSDIQTIIKEA